MCMLNILYEIKGLMKKYENLGSYLISNNINKDMKFRSPYTNI